ncbi:MAG: primosomal protein N' [Simkaniaceae bacterium]
MALDVSIDKILDYGIPENLLENVKPGVRVSVPLRNRLEKGLVLEVKNASSDSKQFQMQPIEAIISAESVISKDLFQLAHFMSDYYATPLRKVFHTILPASLRLQQKEKVQFFVKRSISEKKIIALCHTLRQSLPSQAKILDVILKHPKGILLSELLEKAKTSRSPIQSLIEKRVLKLESLQIDRSIMEEEEFFQTKPKTLHPQQQNALDLITKAVQDRLFQTFLIHGITGSGKTEVYLQAIQFAREKGLGVIMLVPEIALTSQTIERLRSRFTEPIAVLHHRLSYGQKFDTWNAVRQGKLQIVIGARSAIFSPMPNLGLVIIDEEHDSSYKQSEEMPCYHARDIAVVRGKINQASVVLGSATPSLESYANAKAGKYRLISLQSRAKNALLPKVRIINMKEEYAKAGGFTLFSEAILEGIKKRLKLGEQVLLFLNRRGYHTSQICMKCSQVVQCPNCDLSLTFHRGDNILSCHLCGYTLAPPPRICPHCKANSHMKFRGAGTEQVERALYAIFPELRVLRMDADTTRHKGSHDRLFKQFRSGKADVLIGTQMIAKGLHFPSVTLVGILNTDSALNIPDFRSSEHVFQLICQVAGRSGRSALPGEVIIQTMLTDHPVIQLASEGKYEDFFAMEAPVREMFHYPPSSKLCRVIFSGKESDRTLETAQRWRTELVKKLSSNFMVHPVMPCSYAKIKGHFRYHFLVKGQPIIHLSKTLSSMKEQMRPSRQVKILIDMDPTSTFF